jgi:Icc-related predicted phosphoesterase
MTASVKDVIRIAAVGDLHCPRTPDDLLRGILNHANEEADVLLLCGDLTDYGKPEEAVVLARLLAGVGIPMLGVLGNHDYESGRPSELERIFCDAGVTMMDGDSRILHDIGFIGVKGFAGGFGERALQPWVEAQYLPDICERGYRDARHFPKGNLSQQQTEGLTDIFQSDGQGADIHRSN